MENQKYILELNNILKKKKMDGGFEYPEKHDLYSPENIKKAIGTHVDPASIPQRFRKKITKKMQPTMEMLNSTLEPKLGEKSEPKLGEKPEPKLGEKPVPNDDKSTTGTEAESNETQTGDVKSDDNNELKNAFKKVNFQSEIETLEDYLKMLNNCNADEINEFIKNNKKNQEQIIINEDVEIGLQAEIEKAKSSIQDKEAEIQRLKQQQSDEKTKYENDLQEEQQKTQQIDNDLKKSHEQIADIKEQLKKATDAAAKGNTDSNNEETNLLKQKLQELNETLETQKKEKKNNDDIINKLTEEIKNKDAENEKKLDEKQKQVQKLTDAISENKKEIVILQEDNIKLAQENERKLKEEQKKLIEKDTEITKIKQKLEDAEAKLKQQQEHANDANIKDEIDRLKKEKAEIEKTNADANEKLNTEITLIKQKLEEAEDKLKQHDGDEEIKDKIKELQTNIEQKNQELANARTEAESKQAQLEQQLNDNVKELQQKQEETEKTKKQLEEVEKAKQSLEQKAKEFANKQEEIARLNTQNKTFQSELEREKAQRNQLESQLAASERALSSTVEDKKKLEEILRSSNSTGDKEKSELIKKMTEHESKIMNQKKEIEQLQAEKARLSSERISSINTSSYNDTCRFSGFILSFPSIEPGRAIEKFKYIKIKYNEKPISAKVCNSLPHSINSERNRLNLEYLKKNNPNTVKVLVGVNGYKLDYQNKKIIADPVNLVGHPVNNKVLNKNLVPQRLTRDEYIQLLQPTNCKGCIRLVFKELINKSFNPLPDDPENKKVIEVYVEPLNYLQSPYGLMQGGGWYPFSKKNTQDGVNDGEVDNTDKTNEDKEIVLTTSQLKKIIDTIDNIVIKLKNYKKTLQTEKKWQKKYAKKIKDIDRLIELSKKINKLYEKTNFERFKDKFFKEKSNMGDKSSQIGGVKKSMNPENPGGLRGKREERKKKIRRKGERKKRENSPENLPSTGGNLSPNVNDDSSDTGNEDKNVKPLTKEKCKKLKKYLDEFYQLLNAIDNDGGDPIVDKIKEEVSNLSNSKNSTELIDKMMDIQKNFTGSTDGDPNNATEILTSATMVIYDILLISIVLICIIVYVLFVINIIKFLYQCFLEVGNSQHNNLLTGNTLRYKLLGYVLYINNCNLPSLFSSFNSVDTSSSTFIRLSEVLKNYFTNKQSQSGDDTFESIFGELADKVKLPDTPETKAEKKVAQWKQEQEQGGNPVTEDQEKTEKEKILKEEIDLHEEEKKRRYQENKSYKEPKFNIFLCIRLIFICIKLFITFITIIVISIITFILLSIVSQMANMDKISIKFFYKQKLFTLLIKLLVVSLIYIFIQLIIYKIMFVKLYNKYLNTYLNIIAIDLKINFIKSLGKDDAKGESHTYFDRDLAEKLQSNIDNDAEIEEKIIELIKNAEVTEVSKKDKIVKYITIYMLLKYLYSYNKDKTHYELCYNYFIKVEDSYRIPKELDIEKNNIMTFYSLIPNKHRSTPINYFKFNDIKNITNKIQYAEDIRETVNSNISQINTFISEANSYFDDDNYIVSFGWYMLVNLILGTIYISMIVTITMKDINPIENFDFDAFTTFDKT